MWRKLRILVLVSVLATAAHRAWLEAHDLEWKNSLDVTVYPINADKSNEVDVYIDQISAAQFLEASVDAGRTPVSGHQSEIPRRLTYTLIGGQTATEIGWLRTGVK